MMKRADMKRAIPAREFSPDQLPFIFAGKRYLLAHFAFRIVLAVWFVVRIRSGGPLLTRVSIAGAVMTLAGFIIRRWARRVMGERFRGYEVRREEKGLETRGPYGLVRHPGYLGLALMDVGLPLFLGVPWGLVGSIVLVSMIIHRIVLEEQLLARTYEEYGRYSAARKRLLPGLW